MRNKVQIVGTILLTIFFIYLLWRLSASELIGTHTNERISAFTNLLSLAIGAVGALLVYLSLRAQVNANRIQFGAINEQRELDLIYRFYEEVKGDLQRVQIEYGEKYKQPALLDSYMEYIFSDRHKGHPYPEFHQYLFYLINSFKFLGNRIKRKKYISESEVIYIVEKVEFLFELYFGSYTKRLVDEEFESNSSKEVKELFTMIQSELFKLSQFRAQCRTVVIPK